MLCHACCVPERVEEVERGRGRRVVFAAEVVRFDLGLAALFALDAARLEEDVLEAARQDVAHVLQRQPVKSQGT